MTHEFHYKSYKNNFKDIPSVIDHMKELQVELANTNLSHLQFFNITYLIITQNVYSRIGSEYFSEELLMRALDVTFAKYYFDALYEYVQDKPTTPAWEIMFDFCKRDTSMPLIYLALGVNAHVNNDLGLSLFDVIKTDFKADFDKVNPVIYSSLNEVLHETTINSFYKPFMSLLIYHWRYKAWKNFENLHSKKTTKEEIVLHAKVLAQALTKVKSSKDFYHLYKLI